ncbi:MAG: restriction endonuclease [Nitrososphaerales archaeon]
MNRLLAHEQPLMPDPHNFYNQSIAAAIRWLEAQPTDDMVGDDSVGWWLLMEFGRYPNVGVLEVLHERLNGLATGKSLGTGALYTFTAISRTLKRSNFPLETIPDLKKTWENTAENAMARGEAQDQIWILQMAAEVWPDLAKKYAKSIRSLSESRISRGVIQASSIVLMDYLDLKITQNSRKIFSSSVRKMLDSGVEQEKADWHVAYDIWAALACEDNSIAVKLGGELLSRQSKGSWDYTSDERVESTSLCGLVLMDLSTAQMPQKSSEYARSRTIHEVVMLLDNYAWLLQNWKMLNAMPRSQAKGPAFEKFIEEWVLLGRDMVVKERDLVGGTDEIDLVLEFGETSNLSALLRRSRFVLVECKHTSEPVGAKEVRAFRDSIRQRRKENCELGIYVSTSGFTADALRVERENFNEEQVLLLLDGKMMEGALKRRMNLSHLISENLKDSLVRRP